VEGIPPVSKEIKVFNSNNLPVIDYHKLEPFQGELKEISKKNIEKLISSIIDYGIVVPKAVWINEGKYLIIDGHASKMALSEIEKRGYKIPEIPYYTISAENEKQAKKILLLINSRIGKITDEGFYSFIEKANIKPDDDIFSKIDFPEIDMENFMDKFYVDETESDDDIPEEVPAKTAEGDLWELGRHRLLCGDCTIKENVDKLLQKNKIDIVITDAPYGVDYSSKNKMLNEFDKGNCIQENIQNDTLSEDETQKLWLKCFELIRDNLADIHSYYFFSPQIYGMMMMMMMMMMKAGIPYKHILIWVKNNHVLGRSDYNYKHEPILYGWKDKHKFYGKGEYKTSVWECDKNLKSDLHPTMKPIRLLISMLLNSSLSDMICYEPFAGSGSTLIACEKVNRICYAIEISSKYCDVIVERYKQWCKKNNKSAEIKLNGKPFNEKG